jgi:hypothetical protein
MQIFKIFLVIFALFGFLAFGETKAVSKVNITGFAWSENVGWVSFNCYNDHN